MHRKTEKCPENRKKKINKKVNRVGRNLKFTLVEEQKLYHFGNKLATIAIESTRDTRNKWLLSIIWN